MRDSAHHAHWRELHRVHGRDLQGWRRLRRELRLYYGAHLHRRLFFWFAAAIAATALSVGAVMHVASRHAAGRPPLWLLIGVPVVILWTVSGKLARRIARPLYDLSTVARQIGDGKLEARVRPAPHVDEIGVLGHAVNDMAARIERQLRDQRELLAAVSHELRTPLGHARVLIETAREQGATERTLSELERELLEMDQLVGELLASARLDFQALTRRPIDAVDLARRALERANLPATRLEVAAGLEPESARLEADPTLLQRALANLIDNAQKHGKGLVRLAVESRPAVIVYVVEDQGPGFPVGAGQAAFEAWSRLPSADGSPKPETSLGLGLSLVARIARAHGGELRQEPREGGGSRVILEIGRG